MPDGVDTSFRKRVIAVVEQIPRGRVMNYGQIAAICGNAHAARIVGGIAHFGDPELPWHRVVKKDGGLASGYPGGLKGHKSVLEAEGIKIDKYYKVKDMDDLRWSPVAQK